MSPEEEFFKGFEKLVKEFEKHCIRNVEYLIHCELIFLDNDESWHWDGDKFIPALED